MPRGDSRLDQGVKMFRLAPRRLCTGRMSILPLRQLLKELLFDDDDPALDVLRPGSTSDRLPTPIERLLRVVRTCLSHLRARSRDRRGHFQHNQLPALQNLRDLVGECLVDESRPLSHVERLRLEGQLATLSLQCELLEHTHASQAGAPQPPASLRRREMARIWTTWNQRIEQIAHEWAGLGEVTSGDDAQFQCWLALQRIKAKVRQGENGRDEAALGMAALLDRPQQHIPWGLYAWLLPHFLALRGGRGGRVLEQARRTMALNVVRLPEDRVLDRVALIHMLACDARWQKSPSQADRLTELAVHVRLRWREGVDGRLGPSASAALDDLHRRNLDRLPDLMPVRIRPALGTWANRLPARLLQLISSDPQAAATELERCLESEAAAETALYQATLWHWCRRRDRNEPSREGCQRMEQLVSTVLQSTSLLSPEAGRLLVMAEYSLMLQARSTSKIDDAIRRHGRALSTALLVQDWDALLYLLDDMGHQRLLTRLGLQAESDRLSALAKYWKHVLQPLRFESEAEGPGLAAVLPQLTGLDISATEQARRSLEKIQHHWRLESEFVNRFIREQANAQAHGAFGPESDSETAQTYFRDAEVVESSSRLLLELQPGSERIGLLVQLMWCAWHFRGALAKAQHNSRAQSWAKCAVLWANEVLALSGAADHATWARQAMVVNALALDLERERLVDAGGEAFHRMMLELDERQYVGAGQLTGLHQTLARVSLPLVKSLSPHRCQAIGTRASLSELEVEFRTLHWAKEIKSADLFSAGALLESEERELGPEDAADLDTRTRHHESPSRGSIETLGPEELRRLAVHLEAVEGAVLEFILPSGTRGPEWWPNRRPRARGVCLIIQPLSGELRVTPISLELDEPHVLAAIHGHETSEHEQSFLGLTSELHRWMLDPPPDLPGVLGELGAKLWPRRLQQALEGVKQLYVCPHRQMFQLPLHALPMQGGQAPCRTWNIRYALRTRHIVELLRTRELLGSSTGDLWALVDTDDPLLAKTERLMGRRFCKWTNQWRAAHMSPESILRQSRGPALNLVLAHAQADASRPGASRIRLWEGGRLLADDIARCGSDIVGSSWLLIACEAASTRVGGQTTPGLALTLVGEGAMDVTSCLYRVPHKAAEEFALHFLAARYRSCPSPFTAACRAISREKPLTSAFAHAAGFVSYGLLDSLDR